VSNVIDFNEYRHRRDVEDAIAELEACTDALGDLWTYLRSADLRASADYYRLRDGPESA
jgi:phosphopentomutase